MARALAEGVYRRDPKADLLSLMEVVEDAIQQGAVRQGGYEDPAVRARNQAGNRLVDAYEILRRWWP